MHNKSFTVDGVVSIIGGRNIADEYFQLQDSGGFFDLDAILYGPIVAEIAKSFDDFWNHTRSLSIAQLDKQPSGRQLSRAITSIEQVLESDAVNIYRQAINTPLIEQMVLGQIEFHIGPARMLFDPPEKLEAKLNDIDTMLLVRELAEKIQGAQQEIVLISPYFIPGDRGMNFWREILANGVAVELVTNSLASTNHIPVHSAYARYRKDLVRAGMKVYEARPDAYQMIHGNEQQGRTSTLHTKLVVIDRRYVFIGSLNLDPRSIVINSEMGVMIDSPALAAQLLDNGSEIIDQLLYRLALDNNDKLQWHQHNGRNHSILTREPNTSWWRRFKARLYKLVPEGQL